MPAVPCPSYRKPTAKKGHATGSRQKVVADWSGMTRYPLHERSLCHTVPQDPWRILCGRSLWLGASTQYKQTHPRAYRIVALRLTFTSKSIQAATLSARAKPICYRKPRRKWLLINWLVLSSNEAMHAIGSATTAQNQAGRCWRML